MTEPTKEQIKEFWGYFGIAFTEDGKAWQGNKLLYWHLDESLVRESILPLDLNNLFKYTINNLDLDTKREVLNEWVGDILVNPEKDVAISLFGVINAKRNIHKN